MVFGWTKIHMFDKTKHNDEQLIDKMRWFFFATHRPWKSGILRGQSWSNHNRSEVFSQHLQQGYTISTSMILYPTRDARSSIFIWRTCILIALLMTESDSFPVAECMLTQNITLVGLPHGESSRLLSQGDVARCGLRPHNHRLSSKMSIRHIKICHHMCATLIDSFKYARK
jgi:hypothetical protein